jgi:DnaJ domain
MMVKGQERTKFLYDLLRVGRDVSGPDMKAAFRQLAKEHHPDVKGGDSLKFKEISKAFFLLSNEEQKANLEKMTEDKFREFSEAWRSDFTKRHLVNMPFRDWLDRFKKRVSTFREPVSREPVSGNGWKHLYFMVDTSASMHTHQDDDPIVKDVPRKKTIVVDNDGIKMERYDMDPMYNPVVDTALSFQKCFLAMRKIVGTIGTDQTPGQAINTIKSIKTVSLVAFSEKELVMVNSESIEAKDQWLHKFSPKTSEFTQNNLHTNLYDTITNSLFRASKDNDLNNVLFVLLTDGHDTNSAITLEKLVDNIKRRGNVHIILMALHLANVDHLRKIRDAAKWGILIRIGEDIQLNFTTDIPMAFQHVHEILAVPPTHLVTLK